jgi:hypothetical protein
MMLFRKTRGYRLHLLRWRVPEGRRLFLYLGVTLKTLGRVFNQHVKERATAVLRAMHDTDSRLLFLEIVMKLYSAKIAPILTYGLEQIWNT